MAFKKEVIIYVCLCFLCLCRLFADTSISSFCSKLRCIANYNFNYGYVDITGKNRSARIYLTLPYIVSGGNVYYMHVTPSINSKGEIELQEEYIRKLTEIFNVSAPEGTWTNLQGGRGSVEGCRSVSGMSSSISSFYEKSDRSYKTNYNSTMPEKGFLPIDTIIIDPGHGGKDPGGIGIYGVKEKEIVLSVAKILYQLLKREGISVVCTRLSDYYVTLKERTDTTAGILKKGKNPVFVSIHANISPWNKNIRGIEVYSLADRATDSEALSVETVENAGFSKNDVEKTESLNFIIADLLKDAVRKYSERLSQEIGDYLREGTGQGVKSDKKANFYVLRYNNVPSILVEIGYLSNPIEMKNLMNKDYQVKIAKGIGKGIISFIDKYNGTRGFKR